MKSHLLCLAITCSLSALSLPATAIAQTIAPATSADGMATNDRVKQLDKVTVTGTRTTVTVDDSLAAVEVIDRDDIERSQALSLQDLLRGRAGINLANQGGLGKLSTVFLRGTESDHTLFLIDGVRVGSATSGLTSLQDLPLELIDRIEIVRGPRSSLYGSEAIGGVIQIFTRIGRTGVHPRLHLGGGSHGLRKAGGGVDIGGKYGWLGIDYSHQASDGINACRGIGAPLYAGCGHDSPDPDRDGYENNSLSLRAGLDLGEDWEATAHALRSQGHNAYDANPAYALPDNSDTLQQVVAGKLRYSANDRFALQLTGGRNIDASDNYLGTTFGNRFYSTRDSATLQTDINVTGAQLLTIGLDWSRDIGGIDDPSSSFVADRSNRAGFLQYQGRFGGHDLQAAVRHDDNDQFGGHDTGSLAWGMDAAHGLRFTASYGSAFKAPSFNELYYPYYGNPDLQPETSRSLELGVAQRRRGWHWQANAYQTSIDQLIVYDPRIFIANNIEDARIRGVELTAGTTLAGWDVSAQASWLDPRNRSNANDGKLLPRRARDSARIDADRNLGRWRIGGSLVAEGARYDDVANSLRLGGYTTLDLRAEVAFARRWTLQGSVHNAFDRDYETAAFYNQPGREFVLTLRYALHD